MLRCLAEGKRDAVLIALKEQGAAGIDVATDVIETRDRVAGTIRKGPACGMVPLSRDVARGKLHALATGAALVREELGAPTARRSPPSRGGRPWP